MVLKMTHRFDDEPIDIAEYSLKQIKEDLRTAVELFDKQGKTMKTLYERAHELAAHHHKDQMYGDWPYIYHLESVVESIKRKWGSGNEALLAVAILHDILEDTKCTKEELIKAVGKDVTKYVEAVNKRPDEDYMAYIHRVCEFHYSKEVKIHDTLCNLTESIMADSAYRVQKYSKQLVLLTK